jgi:hypothetical protein
MLPKNAVFWDVTPCGSCKNRRYSQSPPWKPQILHGSVSVLRRRNTHILLGPWRKAIRNQRFLRDPTAQVSSSLRLRTETDPVSETFCFLVFRIPDDGQKSSTQVILSVTHHRQNPIDLALTLYSGRAVSRHLPTAARWPRFKAESRHVGFMADKATLRLRFPLPINHSTDCSTVIIVYDPGLVQ